MKRYLVLWMLLVGAALASLPAAIELEFAGIRTYTLFGFLPAPAGADFRLRFTDDSPPSGASAAISLSAGGGYRHERVYREADGDLYIGAYSEDNVDIDLVEFNLEPTFELKTGMPLSFHLGTKSYFRSYIDEDAQARFASSDYFPDDEGSFVNTSPHFPNELT